MTSVPPDSPDPTPSPAEARPVPAAVAPPTLAADAALDRTIDFGRIGWATLLWAVVLVAAAALRFGKLPYCFETPTASIPLLPSFRSTVITPEARARFSSAATTS